MKPENKKKASFSLPVCLRRYFFFLPPETPFCLLFFIIGFVLPSFLHHQHDDALTLLAHFTPFRSFSPPPPQIYTPTPASDFSNRESIATRTMVAAAEAGNNGSRGGTASKRRGSPAFSFHNSSSENPTISNGFKGGAGGRGRRVPVPALSPVHEAAAAGQVETLLLLLQLGVSFEDRDDLGVGGGAGDTPLGRAVRAGRLECARLLLEEAGAMVSRENARG